MSTQRPLQFFKRALRIRAQADRGRIDETTWVENIESAATSLDLSPRHPPHLLRRPVRTEAGHPNSNNILVETKAPDFSGLGTELQRTPGRSKCLTCLTLFELAQSGGSETSTVSD